MRVCNPDRSPVGINRLDAAPTPTGFAELVSDDFPVFHWADRASFVLHTAMTNDVNGVQMTHGLQRSRAFPYYT